jgi:predicted permease
MRFVSKIAAFCRNLFKKQQVENDLDDELRDYLDELTQRKIRSGLDPEAARRTALIELGGIEQIKENVREQRTGYRLESFMQDVVYALRRFRRNPGFSAVLVLTLALGIGANAAIFSVVRGVLLRPLVNRDEQRLIYIRQTALGIGAENTTFSVPEISDLKSRAGAVGSFGDFSTVEFTMTGLGSEPRLIRAGVVSGSYFEVMGLRPVRGRLVTTQDDGPKAAGVAVLTYRFWTSTLNSDEHVIGKTIQLGPRPATVVGILEPSVPYPADTEIIANVVTSPHHLGATMVTSRTHRMTELFARLAPGVSIEAARAELTAAHATIIREHPEAYSSTANFQLSVKTLRDQIVAPARMILLGLMAAAGIVFVIACSNIANLILARSVRRESELAVRVALGASHSALRRTLLAESVVLCGAGAILGVVLARPFVAVVARYASRFSVRALEVTVDASLLWVGVGLAMAASVLLAYIPRLPSPHAPTGLGLGGGVRITRGANRRLRAFATTQIAFSFMLLAGALTLLSSLVALQTAPTALNMRQVLAFDIPAAATGIGNDKVVALSLEATRRIRELPGVKGVAAGSFVPWRDTGTFPRFQLTAEGYTRADGEEYPFGRLRMVSPEYFSLLGVPLLAGREFTDADRAKSEPVVIVSESVAQRLFPNRDAVNRHLSWVGLPFCEPQPCRIVGVARDVDDENVVPGPAMTIYHPVQQIGVAGRLFVHVDGDASALVPAVTRVIREVSADQAVERAATLEDVRAEVLAPERLNAFVISGFAGVALLIAVVGVAGVLAFSVSARTREFGVRLAIGSTPGRLLVRVVSEGTLIVVIGIVAGAAAAYALASVAGGYLGTVRPPGPLTLLGASVILVISAVVGSLMPALRASRVDVLQALRSE